MCLFVTGPPYEPAGVFHETPTVTTNSVVVQWKESDDNGYPILSYVVEAFNQWEGFWRILMTSTTFIHQKINIHV